MFKKIFTILILLVLGIGVVMAAGGVIIQLPGQILPEPIPDEFKLKAPKEMVIDYLEDGETVRYSYKNGTIEPLEDEIVSERTENARYFKSDNPNKTIVEYSIGYPYYNENNEWYWLSTATTTKEHFKKQIKISFWERLLGEEALATTLDLQVGVSTDDGYQDGATVVTLNSTGVCNGLFNYPYVGYRWTGVNIPSGVTVDVAYGIVNVYNASFDNFDTRIYFQDANNPGTFTTTNGNISSRTRTAYVDWDNLNSGTGWVSSPSVVNILQEVVDGNGGTGDALVWIQIGQSTQLSCNYAWDSSSANAPKLHIEYTIPPHTNLSSSVPSSWWTNGLVGYWSFDGQYTTSTAGTRDVSNNGNWGTFNGGVKPVAGISGQALSFDGVDDYVNAADAASFRFGVASTARTLEFWVKSLNTTDTNVERIFDQKGTGNYHALTVRYKPSTTLLYIDLTQDGSDGDPNYAFNITKNLSDTWHHIVFTYTLPALGQAMSTITSNLYIDGVAQTYTPSTAGNLDSSGAGVQPLYIGRDNAGSPYFQGLLDEVRIYNRALGADEVKQHYDQTKRNFVVASSVPSDWWTDGLVGYWSFDGQYTTSTAGTRDVSNNGNWGAFSGGPTPVAGISGQALSFDGVDDYVNVGNVGNIRTVEFWVNNSNATDGILELINNVTYIWISSSVITATGFTSPTIYVNGSSASASLTGGWNHVVVTDTANVASASFLIGEANSNFMAGLVDEVRIYNRALSADEIKQHYQQTRRNLGL